MLDVRQGEQLVEGAQRQVIDAERQIAQGENMVNLLLGNPPGSGGAGTVPDRAATARGGASRTALFTSDATFPTIMARKANLAAQHELVAVARASFFPQITLNWLLWFPEHGVEQPGVGPGPGVQPAAEISQPLVNGGRLRANLELAKGNVKIAWSPTSRPCRPLFAKCRTRLSNTKRRSRRAPCRRSW